MNQDDHHVSITAPQTENAKHRQPRAGSIGSPHEEAGVDVEVLSAETDRAGS
jgi:hypothetical protein